MKLKIENKVLLFDFDGTLVETEFLAKEVVSEYFSEIQFPHPVPFSEMIVGRTWQAATENMIEHSKSLGIALAPAAELTAEFKRRYREKFVRGVNIIPGLLECLPIFQAQSKFMGIVTGSDRDEVMTLLKAHNLEHFFSRIWAYGDYEKSKPDPSPYLQALRDLQVAPADVWVFEDSDAGMESASRAGLAFVQVTHEAHAQTRDPRASLVIDNWKALL